MTNAKKLVLIKLLHTAIWVFYNIVIFYLLYSVLVDKINRWIWIGLALIFAEGLILVIFKRTCPITLVARKYSNSTHDNFDIFLPNWLAKYNKIIYSSIVVIIIVLLLYRLSS